MITDNGHGQFYFIKHLADLQTIPQIFTEQIFQEALQKAEIAKFTPSELETYENSLKVYRDLKGVIDTAFEKASSKASSKAFYSSLSR